MISSNDVTNYLQARFKLGVIFRLEFTLSSGKASQSYYGQLRDLQLSQVLQFFIRWILSAKCKFGNGQLNIEKISAVNSHDYLVPVGRVECSSNQLV